MTDLERAESLLPGNALVFCRGAYCRSAKGSGVRPLLELILKGEPLRGCAVADKIVGKAAALLFVLAGVKEVYAGVLSEPGAKTLFKAGISFRYGVKTPFIINRKGDGPCPMEETVAGTDDPRTAFKLLREKLGL